LQRNSVRNYSPINVDITTYEREEAKFH